MKEEDGGARTRHGDFTFGCSNPAVQMGDFVPCLWFIDFLLVLHGGDGDEEGARLVFEHIESNQTVGGPPKLALHRAGM